MRAIYKRELLSHFTSLLAYVFSAMFMLLAGILFYINNIYFGMVSVKNFFSLLTNWSIFTLPILTMRIMAGDRRLNTDRLLMTAPVSVRDIVLGKFLAVFTIVFGALALIFIYTAVLSFFGAINWAETISCFVGFMLMCGFVLALGTFMSALTDSQIVSLSSTYAVLIVMVFLDNIAAAAPSGAAKLLMWISPLRRFLDFAMGILNPAAIVYYISLTVLLLFLAVNAAERRRFV